MSEKYKKMKRGLIPLIVYGVIIVMGLSAILVSGILFGTYLGYRNHWFVLTMENDFEESGKELKNPNRGFYSMYGFPIGDTEQNYYQQLGQKMYNDSNALSLIQINLREYKNGSITVAGLKNIYALFEALKAQNKQYIVRFLYDWSGKATETEPESIQIIFNHMNQLKPVLEEYQTIIFTLQGNFVGDCGEMHGSVHMTEESMKKLMYQLMENTPQNMFLSVRTPQQWRMITGIDNISDGASNSVLQLGLFNDGMMGTELDTGTYGTVSKVESGIYGKWTREEELSFQEELCRYVPNGGEVIIENPFNDFESAVQSMRTMHVTYLNQAYDGKVLEKWANTVVTEPGCYYGMDGLSYASRMLGYRHLIDTVLLDYSFWQDELNVTVNVKNVGFAPIYKEPGKYITIINMGTGVIQSFPVEAELRNLVGGNDKNQILDITKKISLAGLEPGEYKVFFNMKDTDSDWNLELANEQSMTQYGYLIGSFSVQEMKNPFTGEVLEFGKNIGNWLSRLEEMLQREEKK